MKIEWGIILWSAVGSIVAYVLSETVLKGLLAKVSNGFDEMSNL